MTRTGGGADPAEPAKYVRYARGDRISYGTLEGETIHRIEGDLSGALKLTGNTSRLAEVQLLAPCEPSKVIAVGLNYKSHAGDRATSDIPPLFAKLPTCIIAPGENIVLPEDAKAVHAEAELVLVIGKKAKHVPEAQAHEYVLGVTCGNDVSDRAWQASDLQWLRAKGSDTFGPLGPAIVSGLNYDDLLVRGRLNGETVQEQRSSDLIFSTAKIVSFISRYITLLPGDLIFTGTPGKTSTLKPGDVFEVEIEGVGVLANPVVSGG